QIARLLHEVFPNIVFPIRGILRISGGGADGISAVGLRLRYNERGDVLTTSTPPTSEDNPQSSAQLFFPHFVTGDGWTTQFILFGESGGGASSGELPFTKQDGSAFSLTLN